MHVTVADERGYLAGLAYRMLGSWSDAEDVVQQTFERWYRLDEAQRGAVERPRAWLTTAASRLCLNLLDSARARREQYVGEWLPEPVPTSTPGNDPLARVELDDTVSMALLVVLEALTPAERVAFVLHEVFEVPFPEIAGIVGRTPEATRQLASSARRHIQEQRSMTSKPDEHARLVAAFQDACARGDLEALVAVLDPGVVLRSDGGGQVRAARRPVRGADDVARFLLGIMRKAPDGATVAQRSVNGEPGFAITYGGQVISVTVLHTERGQVHDIWIVMNPDKLRAWNPGEVTLPA